MASRKMAQSDRLNGLTDLTLDIARNLQHGTMIYHRTKTNADGTAMRAKVTSIKTWKKDPTRIAIGFKHGLYDTGKLDYSDLPFFLVSDRDAANCRMRADGWIAWSYRHSWERYTADSHSPENKPYTWFTAWFNPRLNITKIGSVKIYGSPATHCAQCGNDRQSQVNDLNPFPKLCKCGAWY